MKRILVFLLSMLITLTLTACALTEYEEAVEEKEIIEEQEQEVTVRPTFTQIEAPEPERIGNLIVIDSCCSKGYCGSGFNEFITYTAYDEVELVMYQIIVRSTGTESGMTITPLYKADGTLRTYTPEE